MYIYMKTISNKSPWPLWFDTQLARVCVFIQKGTGFTFDGANSIDYVFSSFRKGVFFISSLESKKQQKDDDDDGDFCPFQYYLKAPYPSKIDILLSKKDLINWYMVLIQS